MGEGVAAAYGQHHVHAFDGGDFLDQAAGPTGTIDFGLATASAAGIVSYRIQPTVAPVFTASNPRPAPVAWAPA